MKSPLKVAEIPVQQLWRDSDWINAERKRYLTFEEAKQFIGDLSIMIAVASIAEPLRWANRDQRLKEWNFIRSLLIDGTSETWATQHGQFYVASLWSSEACHILLFEHYH
jgi:hypothetical protein